MKFSRQELKQLNFTYLGQLTKEQLLNLTQQLLADLVEARDRLNANPSNSSIPPSSKPIWNTSSEKQDASDTNQENDNTKEDAPEEKQPLREDSNNESEDSSTSVDPQLKDPSSSENEGKKKAGKQKGTPGFGRTQRLIITSTVEHRACQCSACGAILDNTNPFVSTGGHCTIDIDLPKPGVVGIQGTYTKHLYGKTICACGFETYTKPNYIAANQEWSVPLSEANLIGPTLLAFICFLKLRMHATGSKTQLLLKWFGLSLSIGCINKCLREAGRAVSPLEPQLLAALRSSELIHADETTWKNRIFSLVSASQPAGSSKGSDHPSHSRQMPRSERRMKLTRCPVCSLGTSRSIAASASSNFSCERYNNW